jgi:hypothetical protein
MSSKKVAGLDTGTWITIGVLGAVGIGAYYVITQIGKTAGGLIAPNTGGTAQTTQQQQQAALNQSIAAGNPLSYPMAQYGNMADSLFACGSAWGQWAADNATALSIFDQCNNDSDLLALTLQFGTRGVHVPGIFSGWTTTPMTMYAFIDTAFSASNIASFNQQLTWNGCTLQIT